MQPRTPTAQMKPLEETRFRFSCHPEVSCFGACCSDLTLMLLPYDVVRLRKRLGLGSRAFLDQYTDTWVDEESGVPRLQMRMGDDEERRCPFVSEGACTVYEDRPGACRMFPLGRAASPRPPGPGAGVPAASRVMERFFLVQEEVCAGFDEARDEWDVQQWIADQGARPYLDQNDAWLPVFTRLPALAKDPHAEQRFSVFMTAAYDLDRFRDLVTGEAFTSRFHVPEAQLGRMRSDDEALLDFAIRWLRFALYGEKTMSM